MFRGIQGIVAEYLDDIEASPAERKLFRAYVEFGEARLPEVVLKKHILQKRKEELLERAGENSLEDMLRALVLRRWWKPSTCGAHLFRGKLKAACPICAAAVERAKESCAARLTKFGRPKSKYSG
jgi:rubrerythrin